MPIIKYRIHTRGRPRTLDTDELYEKIEDLFYKAEPRLAQIRKETKGYRGEALLGSSTTAPNWVSESLDLLLASSMDRALSKSEIKEILQTKKSLQELASPQARVYERALSEQFTSQYLSDIEKGLKDSHSRFKEQQINSIREMLEKMSPRERQQFIQSKYYQDPKTQTKRYRRVKKWAESSSGKRNITYEESYAYLNKRRLEEFMDSRV